MRDSEFQFNEPFLLVASFVTCEADHCWTDRFAGDVHIRGEQVYFADQLRGSLTGANALGRQSAVLALSLYDPPGGVFASANGTVAGGRISVGVLPDGRIVEGQRCGWRDNCANNQQIGSWTNETLVVHGVSQRIADLVEASSDIRIRPTPSSTWRHSLSSTVELDSEFGIYHWSLADSMELNFERPQDASLTSPMAHAALAALVIVMQERAPASPPPPPPPPPM